MEVESSIIRKSSKLNLLRFKRSNMAFEALVDSLRDDVSDLKLVVDSGNNQIQNINVEQSHISNNIITLVDQVNMMTGTLEELRKKIEWQISMEWTAKPVVNLQKPNSTDCVSSAFRCKNGMCIAGKYYCDGAPDCEDNSDEDPLTCGVCGAKQFLCTVKGVKRCWHNSWLCDGERHCSDLDDEANAICSFTTKCHYSKGSMANIWDKITCDAEKYCWNASFPGPHKCFPKYEKNA
jgi:hypothetical protein